MFMRQSVYELRVATGMVLGETAGEGSERDAQKEAETEAEHILATSSPGPIPLSVSLPFLAT